MTNFILLIVHKSITVYYMARGLALREFPWGTPFGCSLKAVVEDNCRPGLWGFDFIYEK
tara:strand:- start:148 stop:324 length:177 start_codon:yes stop_codon:yes gene_type:complete